MDVKIEQKVAVLIDGNNIEKSVHKIFDDKSKMINYDELIPRILQGRSLGILTYYREGDNISDKLGKRLHNKFFGIVKPCYKQVDIQLTIDAVQMADKVDTVIICSGDSDYIALVNYLKSRGLRVETASVEHSTAKALTDIADWHHTIDEKDCYDYKSIPKSK